MAKLELEHLAPYLPYSLKGIFTHLPGGKEFELTEIVINKYNGDYDDNIDVTGKCGIHGGETADIENFKPILTPMSDLTKVIIHNGNVFRPICKLLESYCFYTDKMEESEILSYSESLIEIDMSLQTATMLCEWHFDIFGLIDMGLAIGINTYHS